MQPLESIVPIVVVDADNEVVSLAGTGFFVAPVPTLVTAAHVLRAPLPDGHRYAVVNQRPNGEIGVAVIADVRFDPVHDIAAVPRAAVPGIKPLSLQPQLCTLTEDVVALEFSGTRSERIGGRMHTFFVPMTRKGHFMRAYVSDLPAWPATRVWDVSFPALQGASGAPVVSLNGFGVAGMLTANWERELLPAQVTRIQDGDTVVEEIKYFLPTGIAIRAVEICAFLASLGIDPTVVVRPELRADS